MTAARFFYRDSAAPRPNHPMNVGVLALIEQAGKLLLECRSDAGRWGLIGGGLETDESLEQGLRREVYEETGLRISELALFGTFSDPSRIVHYPSGAIVRVLSMVYRVKIEDFSQLRCSAESTELRFFTPDELERLDIVETARHIVDAYLSGASLVLD
jgi:8-oxo-dGTP pyrophosphatase MutT (NUDIX family)